MILRTFVVVLLAAAVTRVAPAQDETVRLHELFELHHEWTMSTFPEQAMRRGDYRFAGRVTDQSLEGIERRHLETTEFARRLAEIDPAGLGSDDRISYELFDLQLRRTIGDHVHRDFLAPIGPRSGPHLEIPQMAEGVRFESEQDYEHFLARLDQVPHVVDALIARMEIGLDEGRTPPAIVLSGVPGQIDALLAPDGFEALATPFTRMPHRIGEGRREALRMRFERIALPAVREAFAGLRTFLTETYLPACRESIAATDLPDGDVYYAHQLWKMTTTDLGAEEIHEIGLAEVARIRAEMMDVIARSDFLDHRPEVADADEDARFAAFIEYLRTDERFYHDTPEALLAGYRDICKRVDAQLPRFFSVLPRLPYGVRAIPAFMAPQQTTAYYRFGSIENGEPGWFFANTYALDQRPKYEMIALAMHEAVPGHHLQSALAQEVENVPEFRRHTWFTAFGEGWALYSERLGLEMGLYDDPYDDFGRLTYEMWRACRLVVDPGMHALGMTRAEAIDFMKRNTALSEVNIATEVDRYIAWPGQACAYKIGEIKIRELRRQAEQKLGIAFDLRHFHDAVLGAGSIPLDVLERRVRTWIRSHPAGASYD